MLLWHKPFQWKISTGYTVNVLSTSAAEKVMRIFEELPDNYRLNLLHVLEQKVCPECGSLDVRDVDDQIVCLHCAVEHNNGGPLKHLTVDYSIGKQGNPVTNLAFGKNLGNTLRPNDMYRVLAKGVGGATDLGLRARQIRIVTSSIDHPTIKSMITIGSELCEEFMLTGRDSTFFADQFGKFLRKVGTAAVLQKTGGESIEIRHLAITTFVYTWQLMEKDQNLRSQIVFETIFPGKRRLSEGTWQGTGIKPNQYVIRAKDWDFVLWAVMMQPLAPTTKKPLMEDPQVMKLLQLGKLLCKQWFKFIYQGECCLDWGSWTCPTTKTVVDGKQFYEVFSKNLLKIGEFWVGSGFRFPQKKYADACFALTMKALKGQGEYLCAAERLNVESHLLISVLSILERVK